MERERERERKRERDAFENLKAELKKITEERLFPTNAIFTTCF